MNPYKILDLPEDATDKEIKDRYRSLAQEHHPDKGGDADKMSEINHAYNLISTPEKRERHRKYGDKPQPNVEEYELELIMLIQAAFVQFEDPIRQLKKKVRSKGEALKSAIHKTENEQKTFSRRRKKFIKKNGEVKLVLEALEVLDKQLEEQKKDLQKQYNDNEKIYKLVNDLEDEDIQVDLSSIEIFMKKHSTYAGWRTHT